MMLKFIPYDVELFDKNNFIWRGIVFSFDLVDDDYILQMNAVELEFSVINTLREGFCEDEC